MIQRRMPVAMVQGGAVYYLAYDQVGSLRAVYTAAGAVVQTVEYDAWGVILDEDIAQGYDGLKVPFGFAGGLHDRDTGLVLFGMRNYDPETGRWTSRDPIGLAGGDTDLYAYCGNDPVNAVDPSGLYYTVGSVWAGIAEGAASVGSSVANIVSLGGWGESCIEQSRAFGGTCEAITTAAFATSLACAGIAVGAAAPALWGAAGNGAIAGATGGVAAPSAAATIGGLAFDAGLGALTSAEMTGALGGSAGDVVRSAGFGALGGVAASAATRAAVAAWRALAPSGLGGSASVNTVSDIADRGSDKLLKYRARIWPPAVVVSQAIAEAFINRAAAGSLPAGTAKLQI